MDATSESKAPERSRKDNGDFDVEDATAIRDARIYELRKRGYSYPAIAAELDCALSTAYDGFKRAVNARRVEVADDARQLERDRLQDCLRRYDEREQELYAMLRRKHILVQHGKVIREEDGEPIEDDEFALKVYDRITQIERLRDTAHQRIVDLDGLKINPTQNVSMQVSYVVTGLDDD